MQVTVLWFAQLRDQRGLDNECVETTATTLGGLYQELSERHGLALPRQSLAPALDDALAHWDDPLREGATVAFLPPVSGG